MDLLSFLALLRQHWSRDSTQSPQIWSPQRPSTGQCAVSSILIRETYGGSIARGITDHGVVHYWNVIDGVTIDATRDQFEPDVLFTSVDPDPDEALYDFPYVRERVDLLRRAMTTPD